MSCRQTNNIAIVIAMLILCADLFKLLCLCVGCDMKPKYVICDARHPYARRAFGIEVAFYTIDIICKCSMVVYVCTWYRMCFEYKCVMTFVWFIIECAMIAMSNE
jgi:hypothetical protein